MGFALMVIYFFLAGCALWFSFLWAMIKGVVTPVEALIVFLLISIIFLFRGTIRHWPFGKIAFGGWATATLLVGLIWSQSTNLLAQLNVCSSIHIPSGVVLGACDVGSGVGDFILQNYGPVLVVTISLGWMWFVRRVSMRPIKIWQLSFFSPAFLMLMADVTFKYLMSSSMAQG